MCFQKFGKKCENLNKFRKPGISLKNWMKLGKPEKF